MQTCKAGTVSEQDRKYIRQALDIAKRGIGKTEPNPAVGCVLVKQGKASYDACVALSQ